MSQNSFISEKIYQFTLFIWLTYFSMFITTYFNQVGGFPSFYQPLLYGTLFLLFLKELINLPKTIFDFRVYPSKLLIFLAFALVMYIRSTNRDGLLDINVLFLVFSARDIPFRKLLAIFSWSTFLVLILTIYASRHGQISNMIMRGDAGYRFSLGFRYVSFASQHLFFGLCSYIMYRERRISYFEIVALFLSTFYLYQQTGTSSPYYLSLLFLLYTLIFTKFLRNDLVIESRTLSILAKWSFLLASLVILYFCFFSSGELYRLVDSFTHNRLRLSVEGFRNFGVSLRGRRVNFTTLDIFGNFSSNYNYIDSSIVQAMVIDGLIYFSFVTFALTKTIKYFTDRRKDLIAVGIVIMILHSMFDPQLLVLYYSPMFLLISRIFRTEYEELKLENELE